MFRKTFFLMTALLSSVLLLQGCSTNAATGRSQFTALMPAAQENQIGASEHEKIVAQFGLYEDPALNAYIREIGKRVTAKTERSDVQYRFYILDTPMVNAFALPGGYLYLSRGLIGLANNEAQAAAVLAHEAAHVTARHSAERYSRSVVTSLGAGVIGAVLGSQQASQALGVGTNLYLSSYSRHQEDEADSLGLRYMTQGGYDPQEMAAFLSSLQADTGLNARIEGRESSSGINYFSTHPATGDRVRKTINEARSFPDSNVKNREAYLRKINGLLYGDSPKQGFTRGQTFYHPDLGFKMTAPKGFRFVNQPSQVVVTNNNGALAVFDMAKRLKGQSAASYITQNWLKDKSGLNVERVTVNGMNAATTSFSGNVNNKPVKLRVIAIEFESGRFARFQVAIPSGAASRTVNDLKSITYSFARLSASERNKIKPLRIRTVAAKSGDTIQSMARRMAYESYQEDRFRVLNGLLPSQALVVGRLYKIVTE